MPPTHNDALLGKRLIDEHASRIYDISSVKPSDVLKTISNVQSETSTLETMAAHLRSARTDMTDLASEIESKVNTLEKDLPSPGTASIEKSRLSALNHMVATHKFRSSQESQGLEKLFRLNGYTLPSYTRSPSFPLQTAMEGSSTLESEKGALFTESTATEHAATPARSNLSQKEITKLDDLLQASRAETHKSRNLAKQLEKTHAN
ncbi:hypothetical protein LTR09_009698 [Extremus antarcticus]|uniref:Uncharacterized protein n=1 Tax=Extremus antarcticus TaxID=702011 RepID=A0AAJ0DFB0_9PEZI|nr:hypothetical protein LTR09_009698 [Extremus antarcticus]